MLPQFGVIMCMQMHKVSSCHSVISVIVPVYNVERWLDRCVTSIVGQTYKNLEIILIDDGSTDRSSEMCDAWSRLDDRIRVVHKANGGLSSARNAGLGIATGARIAFVDSDDWIDFEMLSTMNRWMDEQSAVDVVMCGTVKSWESGREQCIDGDLPQRVFTSDQALYNFLHRATAWPVPYGTNCSILHCSRTAKGKSFFFSRRVSITKIIICWLTYTEKCVESISTRVGFTIIAFALGR